MKEKQINTENKRKKIGRCRKKIPIEKFRESNKFNENKRKHNTNMRKKNGDKINMDEMEIVKC